MAITGWLVHERPADVSADSRDRMRSGNERIIHDLDTALARCPNVPMVYEVRGEVVDGLDEFRRLADAAEHAQPGDFVVRSENKLTGVWIESV
jgi:hypothetical protein